MDRLILKAQLVFGWFVVVAMCAFAQHGNFAGSAPHPPAEMQQGLPPVQPIPPLGGSSAFPFRSHPGFGRPFFPAAFPYFFGDYGYGYAPYTQPSSTVVVVQQPPVYVMLPQTPGESPKPEIHEYKESSSGVSQPSSSEDDQQAFAIVLKDGSVHSAVAVTVQDNALHYVEPDGSHHLVALESVDREETRRLNRERKLQLQLPR